MTNRNEHTSNIDQRIVDWLITEFQKLEHIDLRKENQATTRLLKAAEQAKTALSSANETTISVPFIAADAKGPKHLNIKLTRAKLEELTKL